MVHKARFQKLCQMPEVIFDGGHNENAIKNLKAMINQYYLDKEKIYIVSILKSKDYKTVINLLMEEKGSFIFTSGNDEKRYAPKEELYNEAKKYRNEDIYMKDLENAIIEAIKLDSKKVIMVVRKLLCLWRCFKVYSRRERQMLEFGNVSYKYKDGKKALENINFELKEGEILAIIGKNGSGKSTLARIAAGITMPEAGDVIAFGINTRDKDKFIEFRKNVRNSFSKSRKPNNI